MTGGVIVTPLFGMGWNQQHFNDGPVAFKHNFVDILLILKS